MIKGCQKRVLWVKNIESECFDGAFFIVSDKSTEKKQSEDSMVAEAHRIISSYPITNYFGTDGGGEEERRVSLAAVRVFWFLLGIASMSLVALFLQIF